MSRSLKYRVRAIERRVGAEDRRTNFYIVVINGVTGQPHDDRSRDILERQHAGTLKNASIMTITFEDPIETEPPFLESRAICSEGEVPPCGS